jgi:hypothetical protein
VDYIGRRRGMAYFKFLDGNLFLYERRYEKCPEAIFLAAGKNGQIFPRTDIRKKRKIFNHSAGMVSFDVYNRCEFSWIYQGGSIISVLFFCRSNLRL